MAGATRRSYGTGSLSTKVDSGGRAHWYGKWRSNGTQVKRKLGPKREPGGRSGLTRTQAEAELRRQMSEVTPAAQAGERLTIEEVARRYLLHSERQGRKPSTRQNIECEVRVHLEPFFRGKSLSAITSEDVADLVNVLEGKGLAPKSIRNIMATLSALFTFARAPRRRWATTNPCDGIDLPAVPKATEIRFLTLDEVDALVAAASPGDFHDVDAAMYRTAAMTGLRQGELIALRWRDVDWSAARIRVRQNYVRGQYGTPKSKRSSRSVPMADEVGGELERLFQRSSWQDDGDLVFAHPHTGKPLPKASVIRRFRATLTAAGLPDHHTMHHLRHSFGTCMAAAGVPMRTLQEWMGHRDLATTQIYADYAPNAQEAEMVAAAFARGTNPGTNLSEPHMTSEHPRPHYGAERDPA